MLKHNIEISLKEAVFLLHMQSAIHKNIAVIYSSLVPLQAPPLATKYYRLGGGIQFEYQLLYMSSTMPLNSVSLCYPGSKVIVLRLVLNTETSTM